MEGGKSGWWSNIAADRNELAAYYRTSQAIERHDRRNANVYCTEIITLPHELSARQRRKAVRRICHFFDQRGLPYTVALHLPDRAGDQRNFHVHILYSLRPCERHGAYEWSFAVGKESDINTPEGIRARRIAVVQAINTTLCAAGIAKRYTHLSNKARGMAAGQEKIGQKANWIARRLEALETRAEQLRRLSAMIRSVRDTLGKAGFTLQRQQAVAVERLRDLHLGVETAIANDRSIDVEAVVRARLGLRVSTAQETIAAHEVRIEAAGNQTIGTARREKLSEVRRLFLATNRSLQARQAAMDKHLQDIANRIRGAFSESSERHIRLTALGTIAKNLKEDARLVERTVAIQQMSTVFGDAIAGARNAAAASMLSMGEAVENQTMAGFARLTNVRRTMKRTASIDRLNRLTASLAEVMSTIDARMRGARQEVGIRLIRIRPDMLAAAARTRRLARLGDVAQHHYREQQLSGVTGMIERMIASADQRLMALHRQAAVLDSDIDRADPPNDNMAHHTAPTPRGEARRDPDRRAAIAAAAWQLRRAPFPPQILTATGFAIRPGFEHMHRAADRFEAENVIQKIHAQKRAQMLAAVRRKVENADRSPFIERDGSMRLPLDIFDPPLRRAASVATKDRDFLELFDHLLLLWRKREAVALKERAEARAHKEREDAERRDRMRPGVERIFGAIRARIQNGTYPKPAMAAIKDDVLVMVKAVGEGRLAMRFLQDSRHFYCASAGLRQIVGSLADDPIGRQILFALGKLTLDEPFGPHELSSCLTLSPRVRPSSSAEVGIDSDIIAIPTKGGAER